MGLSGKFVALNQSMEYDPQKTWHSFQRSKDGPMHCWRQFGEPEIRWHLWYRTGWDPSSCPGDPQEYGGFRQKNARCMVEQTQMSGCIDLKVSLTPFEKPQLHLLCRY